MAELSKTAKASMVQAPKEKKAEESTEEAIRQIRIERQAGIWPSTSRIDKLLAAYDALVAVSRQPSAERVAEVLTKQNFATPIEEILSERTLVMAELPAQEEDPYHLVDFGHHTIHPRAEGGS